MKSPKMLKYLLLIVVVIFNFGHFANAANSSSTDELISFPDREQPCKCTGLTCNCCQTVVVNPIKMTKNACVQFTLKILPISLDVKISMDNKTILELKIDPKNPPNYCVPLPFGAPVAMCVKLHDIKLIGLTAMQVCSTMYVNFQTNQIFEHKLPCLKLSTDGIEQMSK